ncbi:MAG: sulfatase-like hydrolase/transferase [Myxococcales bacterium]|nr:sulfatase-like hydrolase/transferase [Myxococcales bacterium]
MSRRRPACLVSLLLLLFLAAACRSAPPVRRPARSVILISIDSLRADHVGCYGYQKPTTPALDRFAAGAVRFANAYAVSSWTLPSHASMFTGLYEDAHLAFANNSRMDDDNVTLAEAFQAAGYETAAIVCAPFLRREYNIQQGFASYDQEIAETRRPTIRKVKTSRQVTDKALAILKERAASPRPFFLFVHYWDVHYDYNPPDEYTAMFDPDYRGAIDGLNISKRQDLQPGMDPRDLAHLIALYDGEIRYTDDHLAELLAFIDGSTLAADTAVVITADHGDEFLEHGSTGHTFTCYEELVRIPLLIRAPGLVVRTPVVDAPIENVDLYPTLLSLAGLPPVKRPIQGYDLRPLIEKGEAPPRQELYCETRMGRRYGWHGQKGIWRSLSRLDGKKIHEFRGHKTHTSEYELYDLKNDPRELTNLVELNAELLAKIKSELYRRHRASLELAGDLNLQDARQKKGGDAGKDDALRDQLKGLGYVQ